MKQSQKLQRVGVGLVCAALMVGCYKHTYTVGSGGNTDKDAEYSAWEAHWLAGLIGETDIDVKAICPSGNATIKDRHSFLNSVVNALVGIIYAPTTVEVYCGEGAPAALTVSPEQLRAAGLKAETMNLARSISATKAAELQSAIDTYRDSMKNVASDPRASQL
jgi:hypothetical protein